MMKVGDLVTWNEKTEVVLPWYYDNWKDIGIVFKKVSAIMSPTGQEVMAPIKTFQCAKCNHLNEQFVPKVDEIGG